MKNSINFLACVISANLVLSMASLALSAVEYYNKPIDSGKTTTSEASDHGSQKIHELPAPVPSVAPGTYDSWVKLEFPDTPDGCKVYYTIGSGTDEHKLSKYGFEFVTETACVYAKTVDKCGCESEIVELNYVLDKKKHSAGDSEEETAIAEVHELPAPVPSVGSGTYNDWVKLEFPDTPDGCKVYYTIDGEAKEHRLGKNGFDFVTETACVYAKTVDKCGCESETVELDYVLDLKNSSSYTFSFTTEPEQPEAPEASIQNKNAYLLDCDTSVTYKFSDGKQDRSVKIPISSELYNASLKSDHIPTSISDYIEFVDNPYDKKLAKAIASYFREETAGYTELEYITAVCRFVQSISYERDIDSTGNAEYCRSGIETLYSNAADCEDACILLIELLKDYYEVGMFLSEDHAMVGIVLPESVEEELERGWYFPDSDGKKYYTIECTGYGWDVGEAEPEGEFWLAGTR